MTDWMDFPLPPLDPNARGGLRVAGDHWWAHLAANWYPKDRRKPREEKRTGLLAKREAVIRLAPRSICEIGVRAGYSAFAMLSVNPDIRFIGIDLGTKHYGDPLPLRLHATKLLAGFPNVELRWENSHGIDRVTPPVDLFHIDGDHSEGGCYQDLELALRSGAKWALLDDAHHKALTGVRAAILEFRQAHQLACEFIPDGHNGTAILHLGGEGGS